MALDENGGGRRSHARKLVAVALGAAAATVSAHGIGREALQDQASSEIVAWFANYDEAFTAKDLARVIRHSHTSSRRAPAGGAAQN